MSISTTRSGALTALTDVITRRINLAAGPDGELDSKEQRTLTGFPADAAARFSSQRGTVRSKDLVVQMVKEVEDAWRQYSPSKAVAGKLTAADVVAIGRAKPSMNALTVEAYHKAVAQLVPPRLPADGLRLPDVRQNTNYTCGPSSLLAVLGYFGVYEGREAHVEKALKTDPEWGADEKEIVKFAQKCGLKAEIHKQMTLDTLAACIRSGSPVIVGYQAWQADNARIPWNQEWDCGHYSVVVGVDDNYVYIEDPSLIGGIGIIPCAEFMERWHGWDGFEKQCGIVISSPLGRPAPNRLIPIQ